MPGFVKMSLSDGESDDQPLRAKKRRRDVATLRQYRDSPRRGLRRTLSVTRAEEIQTEAKRIREAQPDLPVHSPADSLFSWSSGFSDFTGLVNWGGILLALGSFRLLLENFIKYGIRIDPMQWLFLLSGRDSENTNSPSFSLLLMSNVFILLILAIEKLLSKDWIGEKIGLFIQVVSEIVFISLPIVFLNLAPKDFSLAGAVTVSFSYTILFLKLWSYIQVNHWCREYSRSAEGKKKRRKSCVQKEKINEVFWEKAEVVYPHNLSLKDIYYFVFAPTLCYELNFPRSSRIRKRFLLKRVVEVIVLINLILALFQQWMVPTIKTSVIPFSQMSVMRITERLLKLALPNHLVWLMCFYLLFHAFLNTVGELLMFADRSFYKDWWNAVDVEQFWRIWNIPVHRWATRHLYTPMIKRGFKKIWAMVTVFFFSAFFHEYLVSVPLRMFRIWAFTGMMSQVPLAMLSRHVVKHDQRYGNVVMWVSLILGQPLAILMYYHDYVVYHHHNTITEYNQPTYA